ncbi:MAG: DUF3820 family protein [Victivallaceae bacterium]
MPLLKNTEFVCLDCEMTGLDLERDRVIEIAVVRFTFSECIDSFESLVNPEKNVSVESMKIHHISDDMLKGQPKIAAILPTLLRFLGENPLIVGHNVGYDLDLLAKEAKRVGQEFVSKYSVVDTLRLAKDYGDSPNNSLEALAMHFNIDRGSLHRAMRDVEINIEVFKHLCRRFRTLDQVLGILSKPIKMKYMPLGKHKGCVFSEIPMPYLLWASKMDFDADLLYSIRNEIKLRNKGNTFNRSGNPFADL